MGDKNLIIAEQCGSAGPEYYYFKSSTSSKIEKRRIQRSTIIEGFLGIFTSFFREILLPYGYPDSVSEDYSSYQIWDTVQAFCSTIASAFTTRAILRGIGVGNAEASALSATITWILKDGSGMLGRILFAWWKGKELGAKCKKWRLFADVLNDAAMAIELIIPYFVDLSTYILCITTTMKSVVGIAGGATRAAITQHQAISGNMADVSAKDGSQETVVNLIASFSSIYLLSLITEPFQETVFIITLFILHLSANYNAVKSLLFKNFNNARLDLLITHYFAFGEILIPKQVNSIEPVLLGLGSTSKTLYGFNVEMGESFDRILTKYSPSEILAYLEVYSAKDFIILTDIETRNTLVGITKSASASDLIRAYFEAVLISHLTFAYNKLHSPLYVKPEFDDEVLESEAYLGANYGKTLRNISPHSLQLSKDYIDRHSRNFLRMLTQDGWDLGSHSLEISQWRLMINTKKYY